MELGSRGHHAITKRVIPAWRYKSAAGAEFWLSTLPVVGSPRLRNSEPSVS